MAFLLLWAAPAAAKGKASKKSASSKVASKAAAAHSNKNAIKRTGIKEASALESQASALAGGADPTTCVAVDTMVADSWCVQSCGAEPPNCPPGTCKCDGPNPSPSPVPGVAAPEADDAAAPADVDERGQTKAEAAAAKAAEDRDTAVAEADESREAADAARAEEDAKRVAEVEAGREAAAAGTAADADAEAPVPSPLVAPDVPDVPDVPLPVAPPVPPVPEFPKPLEAPKDADPRELTDAEAAAAEAQTAKDDLVAAADSEREDAEAKRMQEDEERVAETERIRQEGLDAAAQAAASVAAGGAAAVADKEKAQEKGTAEEKIPGGKIVAGLPKASALVAGSDPASCKAKSGTVAETNWCKTGCTNEPPNCPAEVCECEGGAPGGPAALVPSPAPVLATDIEERPKTKAEKQAEAAVAARDAPKDTLGEVKGEDDEVPELTQQGQPVVTEEGTAKARALSDSEVATQK